MRNLVRRTLPAFLILSCALPVWSQTSTATPDPSAVVGHPVKIEYLAIGGFQYELDGSSLNSFGQFEDLIYPLNDFEATRYLKGSEASKENSRIFALTGLAGLTVGVIGLLTAPSNEQTPFWITAISGELLWDISGLLGSESEAGKFNCVQRYNRFADGKEQILPKTPADEKSLLPVNTAATPTPAPPRKKDPSPK